MKNQKNTKIAEEKNGVMSIVFTFISIFFFVGFIYWTAVPYIQMVQWKKGIGAMLAGDDTKFPNDDFIYRPYNNSIQSGIRIASFSNVFNQYVRGERTSFTPLYDIAFNREKEWVDAHPYRYDHLLAIAKGYEYKANLTGDTSYYLLADEYYQKALALCPERQDLLYAYSQHLSNTGKKQEAIDLLQKMRKQNPGIAQTGYYLGTVYAAGDKTGYDTALTYLEDYFATGNPIVDKTVIKTLYEHFFVYYYDKKDLGRFTVVARRMIIADPSQADVYKKISDYIDTNKTMPYLNIHN
ncbi:MAG: hypothetical protein WCO58_02195 [bacterium]